MRRVRNHGSATFLDQSAATFWSLSNDHNVSLNMFNLWTPCRFDGSFGVAGRRLAYDWHIEASLLTQSGLMFRPRYLLIDHGAAYMWPDKVTLFPTSSGEKFSQSNPQLIFRS